MQRLKLLATSATIFMLPLAFASAQLGDPGTAGSGGLLEGLLLTIIVFSNTVLIPFILGIGFLVFVWGMFQYFIAGGANEESKEKGKSLMIYAILGFLLIIVFWGIINLLAQSSGLQSEQLISNPGINNKVF